MADVIRRSPDDTVTHVSSLAPLLEDVILEMQLREEDRVSLEAVVRFLLGSNETLELPGNAPVVDFALRLDALVLDGEDAQIRAQLNAAMLRWLSTSKR